MALYCISYFHVLLFPSLPSFTSSSHIWCEYFSKFSPCHSITSVNFFLHHTSHANSFKIEPTCVFLSLSFSSPSLKIELLIFNYLCIISTWSFLYASVSHKPYLTLAFPHNNHFPFLWRYKFSIHVTFKNIQAHIRKLSFCLWFICLCHPCLLLRWHSGKESTWQCRRHKNVDPVPGSGRFPGGGNGSPL